MKKLICKILGCDFRYNFPSIPNKCICVRCDNKYELNLKTFEWESVDLFDIKYGTDEDRKKRWHK